MDDDRIPKKLLYGELVEGKRSHGGQKKRYKDTLKATLKDCKIDPCKWEETALDRSAWRQQTKAGVTQFEADRIIEQKRKREVRKSSNASLDPSSLPFLPDSTSHLPCPHCFASSEQELASSVTYVHIHPHHNLFHYLFIFFILFYFCMEPWSSSLREGRTTNS